MYIESLYSMCTKLSQFFFSLFMCTSVCMCVCVLFCVIRVYVCSHVYTDVYPGWRVNIYIYICVYVCVSLVCVRWMVECLPSDPAYSSGDCTTLYSLHWCQRGFSTWTHYSFFSKTLHCKLLKTIKLVFNRNLNNILKIWSFHFTHERVPRTHSGKQIETAVKCCVLFSCGNFLNQQNIHLACEQNMA